MARPGPKPKPTERKVVEMTRRDRVNEKAPQRIAGIPSCPTGLSPGARKTYNRLAGHLDEMGVLSMTDGEGLAALAIVNDIMLQANKAIREHGILIADDEHENADGTPALRKNPAISVVLNAAEKLRAYLNEYGLTPSARGRILTGGEEEDDEVLAFARRRRDRGARQETS